MRALVPRKSGIHRTACCALYRSLLRSIAYQPAEYQSTIQTLVQGRFRRDAVLQSPRAIAEAFDNGRLASQYLTCPSQLSGEVIKSFKAAIASALPPRCPPAPSASGPRVWAYPGATSVIKSRPRPSSAFAPGKRRLLPVLCHVGGFPFLRFKKPQSPFLTRVLRNKLVQRQKRLDTISRLQIEQRLAADEDAWDNIIDKQLSEAHGDATSCDLGGDMFTGSKGNDGLGQQRRRRPKVYISQRSEKTWTHAIVGQIKETSHKLYQQKMQGKTLAKKLWKILKEERALKVQEEGARALEIDDLKKGRGLRPFARFLEYQREMKQGVQVNTAKPT